jgi:anaerobic magnesium-protoporphyrin IX monomethyl ester cyclase
MCDDIFGLKPGWVQEFRDEVKSRNLNFKYKIQSRVDLLLKEDSIEALAQSGLHEVWVGAESGSQKILDAMDKGTQLSQIEEATRILKSKGVRVAFFLQFGYLGETKEDIQKTIDMVNRLKPDDIGISVSYPLPGTKFYEKVKSQLGGKQNWTDSDDLAMMYQGTFSSAYYKKLHRFVHKEFRKAKALEALANVLKGKANPIKKAKPILSYLYYGPTSIIDKQQLKRLETK